MYFAGMYAALMQELDEIVLEILSVQPAQQLCVFRKQKSHIGLLAWSERHLDRIL
jgi:hypothetical protein